MSAAILILCLATAASVATLCGGALALRFRDKLHLLLGFSAGAVIAVAFFDLLPQALNLASGNIPAVTVMSVAGLGFFGYAVLDRLIILHTHADDSDDAVHVHHHNTPSWLGAGSLSAHSLLDGLAIGLGLQVSTGVGIVVTVAVLAHDCSDGMNTVNLVLGHHGSRRSALAWLLTDAAAPLIGAVFSLFLHFDKDTLALLLALFAGFFLFIGASDLLPESHHAHPKFLTTLATLAGAAFLYVVISVAGAL